MPSVHEQHAVREDFELLPNATIFRLCVKLGSELVRPCGIGKMTKRGHSAEAGNRDNLLVGVVSVTVPSVSVK